LAHIRRDIARPLFFAAAFAVAAVAVLEAARLREAALAVAAAAVLVAVVGPLLGPDGDDVAELVQLTRQIAEHANTVANRPPYVTQGSPAPAKLNRFVALVATGALLISMAALVRGRRR
jgi:hypothetical protein